jgi:hypothetical protein
MDDIHIIGAIVMGVLVLILLCKYFLTEDKEFIANIHPDPDDIRGPYPKGLYRDSEDLEDENLDLNRHGWAKTGVPWYGWGPWWNSMRHTRNMSYDLRGDIPPYRYNTGPWWNSELI